jgi:hypothetical protein
MGSSFLPMGSPMASQHADGKLPFLLRLRLRNDNDRLARTGLHSRTLPVASSSMTSIVAATQLPTQADPLLLFIQETRVH